MKIIGEDKLERFWHEYRQAEAPLKKWRQAVIDSSWCNFFDVRNSFRSADYYKGAVIFDVGGNKYRLIATIHYRKKIVYVDKIMTHLEYSTDKWKRQYDS